MVRLGWTGWRRGRTRTVRRGVALRRGLRSAGQTRFRFSVDRKGAAVVMLKWGRAMRLVRMGGVGFKSCRRMVARAGTCPKSLERMDSPEILARKAIPG